MNQLFVKRSKYIRIENHLPNPSEKALNKTLQKAKKTAVMGDTLAGTDLLCMLNWGTQWTMVSYLKK